MIGDFFWSALGVFLALIVMIFALAGLAAVIGGIIATFGFQNPMFLLVTLGGMIVLSIAIAALNQGFGNW